MNVETSLGAEFNVFSEPKKVIKWCKQAGQLTGSQKSKAIKLCDYESIAYVGEGLFICLPLNNKDFITYEGVQYMKIPYPKNYNKDDKPYLIRKKDGLFSCSCQWNVKTGKLCSHIMALHIEFRRNRYGGVE